MRALGRVRALERRAVQVLVGDQELHEALDEQQREGRAQRDALQQIVTESAARLQRHKLCAMALKASKEANPFLFVTK